MEITNGRKPKLQRVIQELFREGARIPGGTAGAVRHEIRTGALVGRKSHVRKALERRRQLQNILRRERLGDRRELLQKARKFMGPRTRQFSEEVEDFWGRKR